MAAVALVRYGSDEDLWSSGYATATGHYARPHAVTAEAGASFEGHSFCDRIYGT